MDRVRYDHTCSTHRNTSKLKMISRVPIPFVRHSQKQSRVRLKLIGPDEVAHNKLLSIALSMVSLAAIRYSVAPSKQISLSTANRFLPWPTTLLREKRGNSARFPDESCTRIAAAVPRPSGRQAPRRVTRETLADRGGPTTRRSEDGFRGATQDVQTVGSPIETYSRINEVT